MEEIESVEGEMMLVSIIIPVYNAEKYLQECIESVIFQTISDFEAIFVNDGSTDNSIDVLRKYTKQDSRIKVIDKINEGVSSARNAALLIAKGTYITFCDSDDFLLPNYLEVLLSGMKNDTTDLVATYPIYYENGEKRIWRSNDGETEILDRKALLESLVRADGLKGYVHSKLFKKSIIKENNLLFDDRVSLYEDLLFCVKYCKYVRSAAYIHSPVYCYRRRSDSAIHHENRSCVIAWKEMLENDDGKSSSQYTQHVKTQYVNSSIRDFFHNYRSYSKDEVKELFRFIDANGLAPFLDSKGKILFQISRLLVFPYYYIKGHKENTVC